MPSKRRNGVTLIELIVVLTILGTIAGVVGLSLQSANRPRSTNTIDTQVAALRQQAISSGQSVTGTITTDSTVGTATAHPDGSVFSTIGDVEQVTGRPRATR